MNKDKTLNNAVRISRSRFNVLIVFFSLFFSGVVILLFDFFLGKFFLPPEMLAKDRPFLEKDLGWYELKPDYSGFDQFGPHIFPVATDSHGFRKAITEPPVSSYDIIFLGDSFTYGVNGAWEETFVGMYARESGRAVINAGVSSYSPTAYAYQYRKATAANMLKQPHIVVVGIDISDVQDEAGIWMAGDEHPRRQKAALDYQKPPVDSTQKSKPSFRKILKEKLPLTFAIYRVFRPSRSGLAQSDWPVFDRPRSAFTHVDWDELNKHPAYIQESGYAPLGVRGGLDKIVLKLADIGDIARQQSAEVYYLIYPYPAQIHFSKDKFSWSEFMRETCKRNSCRGVIDTIPQFRRLANETDDWYRKYFIDGDVHFNEGGNRIVADALLKALADELPR